MNMHEDNLQDLSPNTSDPLTGIAELYDKPILEDGGNDSITYRYPRFSHMRNTSAESQRRKKSISNSSFFRLLWRSKAINPHWQLQQENCSQVQNTVSNVKVSPIAKADRAFKRCLPVTDCSLLHCSVETENLSCALRVILTWIYRGVGETKDLPLETASFTWTHFFFI